MIDFNSFKNEWFGKLTTYGAAASDIKNKTPYQCVCLVKEYLRELSGQEIGTMGNAINWWNAPKPQLLQLCSQVSGNNAQTGDIVVKRPNHIGIATGNSNANQVEILEQDGHTGTGRGTDARDHVRTRYINRSDIAGLYRFNSPTPPPSSQISIKVNTGEWNVRTGPSLSNPPIKQGNGNPAPALGGQTYGATIDANGWAQITFLNQTGYLGPKAYTRL